MQNHTKLQNRNADNLSGDLPVVRMLFSVSMRMSELAVRVGDEVAALHVCDLLFLDGTGVWCDRTGKSLSVTRTLTFWSMSGESTDAVSVIIYQNIKKSVPLDSSARGSHRARL